MCNVAIVGATGLVGSMFLKVIEEKQIKFNNVFMFASEKSEGKEIVFMGEKYLVEKLCKENIVNKKIDYALFSAGGKISKEFAPIFVKIGATVIDNSSAWRMDKDVPLVVPQVNFDAKVKKTKLIANPNCSTIQCMEPLYLLNRKFKLRGVHFVTFQAVSGSGKRGIADLKKSLNGEDCVFYPYNISKNCLPHIGDFDKKNYTSEEMKMVNETKKILKNDNLSISATCVRVPIENCHSICVEVEFEKNVNLSTAKKCFKNSKSVVVLDDVKNNIYPLAELANGTDKIYVGRIRKDLNKNNVLHFFCVADNLRKGAASNAVEILEKLL